MKTFASLILIASGAIAQPGPPPPQGGQGDGIWRRNAYFGERQTFDQCVGHQPGTGQYHYHANPVCLRAQLNDNLQLVRNSRTGATYVEASANLHHSPILGWALDGYPIYGPYGYSDSKDPGSAIRRITSGFRARGVSARTTLPDWSLANHPNVPQALSSSQYGPAISAEYPLGRYLEDYEWAAGVGDLDQYNGRFTVTPEFPSGTYAYYVTIDSSGSPAFPFILAGQFYGATGAFTNNVSGATTDYFNSGTYSAGPATPALTSWSTTYSTQYARVVSGFDPSAGPFNTWPAANTLGVRTSGGVAAPVLADTQRIRYTDSSVYVTANGLAGYAMGPWFSPDMTAGVFSNFPSANPATLQMPRSPSAAASRLSTSGGPQGLWVNGVAVFNFIDGASYSVSAGSDVGGGLAPSPEAVIVSAASFEQGPLAPGSLVAATALYTAVFPTSTAAISVSVKDSAGTAATAQVSYASASQLNFQMPAGLAAGAATVTMVGGGQTIKSNINIQAVYPNLFLLTPGALAAANVIRVHNGVNTTEPVFVATLGSIDPKPVALNGDQVYLVVYGSGLGSATTASATIGGLAATVAYAGPQGTYAGLDQYNLLIPASLAGKGQVDVVVTAGGKSSNPANITIQ